jgi:hypothetical protein
VVAYRLSRVIDIHDPTGFVAEVNRRVDWQGKSPITSMREAAHVILTDDDVCGGQTFSVHTDTLDVNYDGDWSKA